MILDGKELAAIDQAVEAIRRGELVGMPTETVYGLAADACNPEAVAGIFSAKGRPVDHPLIVHVADQFALPHFASDVPQFAFELLQAFWPGPLTLILPRRPGVAAAAAGGQDSIGLRCPAHPVARRLLQQCALAGVHGLAAPSANRFGKLSPTTARHVEEAMGPRLLILDGGPCAHGIESAIVDCTRGQPVLLRPGTLSATAMEAACGLQMLQNKELSMQEKRAPRASGMLEAHYAPKAKVRLMDARALQDALDVLGSGLDAREALIAVYARSALRPRSARVLMRRMPDDALASAQQLFAALHEFDASGVRLVWIETPPADPAWDGVRDRLERAAAS